MSNPNYGLILSSEDFNDYIVTLEKHIVTLEKDIDTLEKDIDTLAPLINYTYFDKAKTHLLKLIPVLTEFDQYKKCLNANDPTRVVPKDVALPKSKRRFLDIVFRPNKIEPLPTQPLVEFPYGCKVNHDVFNDIEFDVLTKIIIDIRTLAKAKLDSNKPPYKTPDHIYNVGHNPNVAQWAQTQGQYEPSDTDIRYNPYYQTYTEIKQYTRYIIGTIENIKIYQTHNNSPVTPESIANAQSGGKKSRKHVKRSRKRTRRHKKRIHNK